VDRGRGYGRKPLTTAAFGHQLLKFWTQIVEIDSLGGAGLVLAIAFSGGLALQSTYQASFAAFVNSNAAEVVGLLIAVAMSLVFRTIDPAWNARRISRAGQKAVSLLATRKTIDLRAWTIQMFDRLGLVTSRINAAGDARLASGDADGLRDLRVGLNIGTLRGAGEELGSASCTALRDVVTTISTAYTGGLALRSERSGIELTIDRAIAVLETEASSRPMRDALAALTGLRLDLRLSEANT
jgi:uncharacterized membrane protein YccC